MWAFKVSDRLYSFPQGENKNPGVITPKLFRVLRKIIPGAVLIISSSMTEKSRVFNLHLSEQRLNAYADPTENDFERTLIRYQANIIICEALYPILHLIEVTVRNHIYQAISRKKQESWLTNVSERWMRNSELVKIQKAKNKLNDQNKDHEPGRLIAELNFGFWTSLFDRYYEKEQLWSGIVQTMFSKMPPSTSKIRDIRTRLNRIRDLRNRVFHYEPIWHWGDLTQKHDEIIETIGWISPDIRAFAEKNDRFQIVYKQTEAARVNSRKIRTPTVY